jgi:hypothetical protein
LRQEQNPRPTKPETQATYQATVRKQEMVSLFLKIMQSELLERAIQLNVFEPTLRGSARMTHDEVDEYEEGDEKHICLQCRRRLRLGVDVWSVEQGVIGPRGVVPLEAALLFCGEECLSKYFNGAEVEVKPRRIP